MRREPQPSAPPASGRRRVRIGLMFVAAALALNALVGERGLIETFRARHQTTALLASIGALRTENARLREQVRRLKEDPTMIEALARRELGLIRRGEVVFVLTGRR